MQGKNVGRLISLASILAILLAAPLAFGGQSSVLKMNDAECREGTCCPEYVSWCNIGGGVDHEGYYKKLEGSCMKES